MAMVKTNHKLCRRGFLKSTTSGNYTRFNDPAGCNHWIGKATVGGKNGWQARRYPKGGPDHRRCDYWEGPVVGSPVAALISAEIEQWGG